MTRTLVPSGLKTRISPKIKAKTAAQVTFEPISGRTKLIRRPLTNITMAWKINQIPITVGTTNGKIEKPREKR